MKSYGKQIQFASIRGISWQVVVFSGKRGVFANSLSGPFFSSHLGQIEWNHNISCVYAPSLGVFLVQKNGTIGRADVGRILFFVGQNENNYHFFVVNDNHTFK